MELMAAVRALHLAALCGLAGGFAFPLFVVPQSGVDPAMRLELRRSLAALRVAALAIALVSWLAWLVLVAAGMSGQPLAHALDPSLLDTVLRQTRFGHLWVLRCAAMLLLARYLAWPRRTHLVKSTEIDPLGALLLVAVLVSQVWAGHATAAPALQIAVDALHLLGAALWLGTLPPLFHLLRQSTRDAAWKALAATATRRFSGIGMLAVGVLALTGIANGLMMVGSVAGLTGSVYGLLLVAKVALFAAMLVIAACNRYLWTPRLEAASGAASAARGLWRNVAIEIVIGAAILGVVGVLGGSQPPAHERSMEMPGHDGMSRIEPHGPAAAPISVVAGAACGMKAVSSDCAGATVDANCAPLPAG